MKKTMYRIVFIICLGVFLYAGYGIATTVIDYYKNSREVAEIQETFYEPTSAEEIVDDVPVAEEEDGLSIRPEFQELHQQNEDIVGWIKIEDTKIDYPILHSKNNEEYLTQNFNKEYSILGSIFMDYRNDIENPSKNTIIYGHRTKNGTMFEHLTKFKDQDFLKNHPTIELDTLYESIEAEVFAVYITTTDFNYIQTDFISDKSYEQFLTQIKEASMFDTDVEVTADDRIITLSTCDYELDNHSGRMVVQAKIVE
ncbi:class B sortase [Ornithinibacillus halophilus]|uniref:Sortase B. Cysteine peptidase. MEROPS family C60B n=1 Tax=Ornithinibacillus halophilus TaxID=930117 RepID=A0A1M5KG46_9BACI|nr:class B sortase [Ornithinibacillus halophilus]SHG51772.1 sortase B. Cysteine peptidase. MEROPS family C60B [Ornithinibacillus halophilus]